jgi:hypothetical protein
MKALHKMDNQDKGELLTRLFPEKINDLQNAVKTQCEYFKKHELSIREGWQRNPMFTADFWFQLVESANNNVKKYGKQVYGKPSKYGNLLYTWYNAIFTIHCLIEYADSEDCTPELKQAIHLLFGSDKFLQITLNDK